MYRIHINGIVQGVGFRPFIYRLAIQHNLRGYVRNLGDAGVEIVVECDERNIQRFVEMMKNNLPPLARIYDIRIEKILPAHFDSFKILESLDSKETSGSVIPPDVGICESCLAEMRDQKNRRYNYFFTTCTDCGPRFTIIDRLPYDRQNTSMKDFPMDARCATEYHNPVDRRYHAQTVACEDCGPKAWLADKNGNVLSEQEDAIWQTSKLLSEGAIIAIKGNGGFHIATATSFDEPVSRLREKRRRRQQPFAVMARDIESVRTFAEVEKLEEELLASNLRPIVLLRKSEDYDLAESISPGLHNIGVMLPYTGMHHMLFDRTEEKAFVMTSANLPGDPMIMDNDEALTKLSRIVDCFLFHNRRIVQRCDDSVIRIVDGEHAFIRRSRGYAPAPVEIDSGLLTVGNNKVVLAIGAELCVTSCILNGNRAFLSQHIGDVEKPDTLAFLEDATRRLMHLTNSKPDVIVCDLHPQFFTTRLARRFSEEFSIPLKQVQHHWAHAASLMAEYGMNEIIAIVTDGMGYGTDGAVWGGEILYANTHEFKRMGHLQEQPMPGGDLATRYPIRMAAGMLGGYAEEFLIENEERLPHGAAEAEVILKQIAGRAPRTTSCGRVLDATSAILGLCYERTYEGEPAMKLESAAIGGKDVLGLEPEIKDGVLITSNIIQTIYENRDKIRRMDLAYSVHSYLAKGLAKTAAEYAKKHGLRVVGFSGGCAYNEVLVSEIRRLIAAENLNLITNTKVPRGDGGISFGQAVIGIATSSNG